MTVVFPTSSMGDERQFHLKFDASKGQAVDDYLEYRRSDIIFLLLSMHPRTLCAWEKYLHNQIQTRLNSADNR